ncbi:hypothetical protein BGZ83_006495 [Gryganskiella cystojenkinii]|nr:hypothetical protein BGZ83_006495 [Gryganskiella cystojenkinii]
MLGFVFLLLSCFVAVQTKPKEDTFVPYLTTQRKTRVGFSSTPGSATASTSASSPSSSSGAGVSRWFTKNILEPLTGPQIPDHTIKDYYFFLIATLNDGSGQYLGMFQQWWPISELQELASQAAGGVGSGGSRAVAGGGNAYESQAEAKKQEAVTAKVKKDYAGAARAYVETAKLFEKSGSQFNMMEAASAYEDAFKAYNMTSQTAPGIQCLENAARLFRSNDRGGSRAAKIYSQLGDLLKSQDPKRAVEMHREAAELYKSESDGRALYATVKEAELLCTLNGFSRAFKLYDETIIPETQKVDILKYTTRDHILNAMLAHLGETSGDWVVFEKDLGRYEDLCPDFRSGARGHDLLQALARAERQHDAIAFQGACQEFDRLQSGGMPDWQVGLLLKEKKKLEDGALL